MPTKKSSDVTLTWEPKLRCYVDETGNVWVNCATQAHALRARAEKAEAALRWYRDQAEGCRKLGGIGDPFRHALDEDGGQRARSVLAEIEGGE